MKLPEYTYNSLFRPTANWHMNAAVGNNGGPYNFRDYAIGFFLAGHHIYKRTVKRPLYVDVIVYPMAFNYRHGVELYLKSLLLQSQCILGREPSITKSHGILDNWTELKGLIPSLDNRVFEPRKEIQSIELVLHDFCEVDPTGQVFRYPEDIKGNQHLVTKDLISIEVLYEMMQGVEEVFERWSDSLAARYEINAL